MNTILILAGIFLVFQLFRCRVERGRVRYKHLPSLDHDL